MMMAASKYITFVFVSVASVYLGRAANPVPDLHWSFENTCRACPICIDSTKPYLDKNYEMTGNCSSTYQNNATTEGVIGDALHLQNMEALINMNNNSNITLLGYSKGYTLCFWMKFNSLESGNRPKYLFQTAEPNIISDKPETIGVLISIDYNKIITVHVKNPAVFYEIILKDPVPFDEWIYFTLVWSEKNVYPQVYFNGTRQRELTKYNDSLEKKRINRIVIGAASIDFTIDEFKMWFQVLSGNVISEIFREASIDPADFTTELPTTTQEETTMTSTTTTTTTTTTTSTTATPAPAPAPTPTPTSTTTTTSTPTTSTTISTTTSNTVPQTTTPLYLGEQVEELEEISKELYDNQVESQKKNLTVKKDLVESSVKTNKITEELTKIFKDENVQLEPKLAMSYISAVSKTTITIVTKENAETWLEVEEKTQMLNQIIENADDATGAIVESLTTQPITEIQVVHKKSVLIIIMPPQTEESVTISPTKNVEVGLSVSTVTSLSQNTPVIVAASVHSGANTCYDEIAATDVDIIDRTPPSNTTIINPVFDYFIPLQIITEIVSLNIKPKLKTGDIIKLSFKHTMNLSNFNKNEFTLYCVYINKDTNKWTNRECTITDSNDTHTTFTTTHTTNFAILMQIVDYEISNRHFLNLSLITYIGSSISIFCLVLSLCVFALVNNIRGHRTERYHLHANLALSMLLGQVTFLVGADYEPGTESCKATAILLHFFYMSAFSWMLVEGLHLYNLVVKVFRSSQSRLGYYYMIGWGIPLLICVISVGAAFNGYGEVNNCWLDKNNSKVIWAFVGPALCVIMINIIILAKVTRVISTLAKSKDNCLNCMTDKATIIVCAKGVAVLMPILGVTWVFGVLAVNEDLIIFQYIFAVCNSLQGFFLFVFHCIFNSETRSSLKYRTKSFRNDFQSKSATQTRSRRQTKVELVKNAEQMNSGRALTTTTTIQTTGHYNHGQLTPDSTSSTSRETSASSQNSFQQRRINYDLIDSDNTRSRQSSVNSRKIKTKKIDPTVSKAW